MITRLLLPALLALSPLLTLFTGTQAVAGDPFDDPIAARVVQGWTLPDGRMVAGLELTLEPGWKTYWRAPGDAGIPPQFDWGRARNLAGLAVTWPTPEVFHQNGMRSIGYKNRVVIPVVIAPRKKGSDVRLRGRMDIGVCADVCMPHQLNFDATLAAAPTAPVPAIAAAMAQVPFTAAEAGVTAATCSVRPSADGMMVTVRVAMPSAGGTEVAVIEPGIPDVWTSEAQATRQGGWIEASSEMVHTSGGPFAINRSNIRITVLGSRHAVDIKGCTAG